MTGATCYSEQRSLLQELVSLLQEQVSARYLFLYIWSNFLFYWSNLFEIDTVSFRNNLCELPFPRTKRKRMESDAHFSSWWAEDLLQFHASDPAPKFPLRSRTRQPAQGPPLPPAQGPSPAQGRQQVLSGGVQGNNGLANNVSPET